jgi:hypothetical protein
MVDIPVWVRVRSVAYDEQRFHEYDLYKTAHAPDGTPAGRHGDDGDGVSTRESRVAFD